MILRDNVFEMCISVSRDAHIRRTPQDNQARDAHIRRTPQDNQARDAHIRKYTDHVMPNIKSVSVRCVSVRLFVIVDPRASAAQTM